MLKLKLLQIIKTTLSKLALLNRKLLKQLLLLLIVFQALRFLFFVVNLHAFEQVGFRSYFGVVLAGLRFDLAAILIVNSLYFLLSALPFQFVYHKVFQLFLTILFIISNFVAIFLNLIDVGYFKFSHKRLTFDFLKVANDSISPKLFVTYFTSYWYLVLVLFSCLYVLYKIATQKKLTQQISDAHIYWAYKLFNIILVGGLIFVGARGGVQGRPLSLAYAAEHAEASNIPLVLNSTFSFINTINNSEVKTLTYFNKNEVEKIYSPIHFLNHNKPFTNLNVVLIVLESFGKEYIGYFNKESNLTPFLDSLMKQSTVFKNSFANATRSIEGIPAIVASIPNLQDNAFCTSSYSANQVTSIANLLNAQGYNSSFYHGGKNGTMMFDAFAKLSGYHQYNGLNEYPNKNDFDGSWGVWDEPYLQYVADELNHKKEPFFSTAFTLSSHDPYKIPAKYASKFKEGKLPIHKAITYTDYALMQFFNTVKNAPWFKNTLFVITADHTSQSNNAAYSNTFGYHKIPIIFYQYNQTPKVISTVTQHIDVLPNIMEYLNYDQSYFSFGKPTFENTSNNNVSVNFTSNIYQTFNQDQLIIFDTRKVIGVFDLHTDSLIQNNLIETQKPSPILESYTKAYLQTYTHCLTQNKMTVNNYFGR